MSKRTNRKAANREPMKWHQVWRSALGAQEASFRAILQRSEVTRQRALVWMAIGGLVGYVLLIPLILQRTAGLDLSQTMRIGFLVGGAVVAPLISIAALWFYAGTAQFVAQRMGGRGAFTELMYALAAFLAPVFMLMALVSLIAGLISGWVLLIASFLLSMYQLLGCAAAIMAAHQVTLQKAFAASVAIALVLAISLSATIQSLTTF